MAISNITPVVNSLLEPGDSFSFDVDDTYTVLQIEVDTGSGTEYAYDTGLGGAQPGYTVSVSSSGGTDTFTVSRGAGWPASPQIIRVIEDESGSSTTTALTYYLTATEIFPQGSEPYNPTNTGTNTVTEDDVIKSQVAWWFDFDDATFDVTDLGNGKVRIVGLGGGGGSAIEVQDNGTPLTTDVTLFNLVGFTVTEPSPDEITVTGTLDGIINSTSADNDVNVPLAAEVILRDGGVDGVTPLTIVKTGGADSVDPAFVVDVDGVLGTGIQVVSSAAPTDQFLDILPSGILFANAAAAQRFYDIQCSGKSGATDGATIRITAGANSGAGDGGNLQLAAGNATGGGADGEIYIGLTQTSNVRFGNTGIEMSERSAALASAAARGRWWVRDDVPNVPMFTDDDGNDYQLNLGGGPSGYGTYLYDSGSTSGAGISNGDIRFNNATITSATELYISKTNVQGINIGGILDELPGWRLSTIAPDGEFVEFLCGAATDNSTYFTIEISQVIGDATITDNNEFVLVPLPSVAYPAINQYAWDGALKETIDVDVTSNGTVITLSVQASGGGDLTAIFNNVEVPWDTTPADTVTLTAGTDASPQINFVYATESGGTITLAASTSSFPSEPYAPVATVICQSAASLQTDGAMKVHVWTDHIGSTTQNGHISHINKKLRGLDATWVSGVAPNDMSVSAPDAYLSVTSGTVLQLHDHAFPALDMSTGANTYLVNDPTTAYLKVGTLDDITQDASGGSINNRHFKLVLWGAVNEDTADCKLFINLPTGTYNSSANAETDAQGYTVYSIPQEYKGVGFLIAEYNVQGFDSGTWVQNSKNDLRGLTPSTGAGGGGGGVGDVTGPSGSTTGSVPIFSDTSGKILAESEILVGSGTVGTGTRTLGASALLAGGRLVGTGTIASSGVGTAALGYVSETSGTANVSASGTGNITMGVATSTTGTADLSIAGGAGAFLSGYSNITAAGTSQVTIASSDGARVHGLAASGGLVRANFSGSSVIFGLAQGANSRLETTFASGGFVQGVANGGGAITTTAAGGSARGNVSGTSSTISCSGAGGFSTGYVTGGSSITAGTGFGCFAGGVSTAGNAITASGQGSFAWGDANSASVICSAANSAQFFPGTNTEATTLQVGDTTNGVRLVAGGAPTSLTTQNGSIWVDGSGDVNISSSGNGVTTPVIFSYPTITGSRGGNAALANLLTALANMGLITDSTT